MCPVHDSPAFGYAFPFDMLFYHCAQGCNSRSEQQQTSTTKTLSPSPSTTTRVRVIKTSQSPPVPAKTEFSGSERVPSLSTQESCDYLGFKDADYQRTLGTSAVDLASSDQISSLYDIRLSPSKGLCIKLPPSSSSSVKIQFTGTSATHFPISTLRRIPDPLGEIPDHFSQAEVDRAEAFLTRLRAQSAARGLRGLGLINVPELTLTMSAATLVSPPVTPIGERVTEAHHETRTLSILELESKLRLSKMTQAKLFISDVGVWLKDAMRRLWRSAFKMGGMNG